MWQLNVKLLSGKNLVAKDTIAEGAYGTQFTETSDPYVVFKVGKATAKSATIQRSLNPEWNEEITMPVRESPSTPVRLTVAASFLHPMCSFCAQIILHRYRISQDVCALFHVLVLSCAH